MCFKSSTPVHLPSANPSPFTHPSLHLFSSRATEMSNAQYVPCGCVLGWGRQTLTVPGTLWYISSGRYVLVTWALRDSAPTWHERVKKPVEKRGKAFLAERTAYAKIMRHGSLGNCRDSGKAVYVGPLWGQVTQMKMGQFCQPPSPTPAPKSCHNWENLESVPIMIAL